MVRAHEPQPDCGDCGITERHIRDRYHMENFQEFCASGTNYTEEMISVAEDVKLRVITFSGPTENRLPDVVFVAGWISLMEGWKEVLLEMTRRHRIYYIETREKISSQVNRTANFDVTSIGMDVVKLIDHFGMKNGAYILFGSSLGATSILDVYAHLKHKPLSVVLVSPNAVFRVPMTWKIIVTGFYPPLYNWLKPAVKWYLRSFRLDLEADYAQYEKYSKALDAGDPWKLKPAVLALSTYEVWSRLKNVDCPTLIFGASRDKLHEPDYLAKFIDLIPDASLVDMGTNQETHSREMVKQMDKYLADKL